MRWLHFEKENKMEKNEKSPMPSERGKVREKLAKPNNMSPAKKEDVTEKIKELTERTKRF